MRGLSAGAYKRAFEAVFLIFFTELSTDPVGNLASLVPIENLLDLAACQQLVDGLDQIGAAGCRLGSGATQGKEPSGQSLTRMFAGCLCSW